MGFTKIARTKSIEHKPEGRATFVPSTKEDLKRYAKNAKKRDAARSESKAGRKTIKLLTGSRRTEYRDMFGRHDTFDVLADNVIAAFAEYCKENGLKVPKYKEFLPRKDADSEFVFDVNYALSRMSWIQLSKIVSEGVGCPVVTREYTEAYNFAVHALIRLALGVIEKNGTHRLTDLSVLTLWPVETAKRPTKEDRKMSKKEAALVAAGKSKGGDDDGDEDEEDEVEETEEEEEDDEEEADDEDEAEEDDDEAEEDGDGEEEGEDDEVEEDEADEADDDDDVEEEEEKPKPKKAAAVKAKPKKAPKKAVDEDEESEDDEDDEESDDEEEADDESEDDEEEEKPMKKGASKKAERTRPASMELKKPLKEVKKDMKKHKAEREEKPAKKGAKPAKAEKVSKKEKPAKVVKKEKRTKVDEGKYKVTKKFKGGVREQAQSVIADGGSTFDHIAAAAKKKFDMPEGKVRNYLAWLAKNGFVKKI